LVAAVVAFVSAVAGVRLHSLAFLVLAALILDAAVQLCQVLSLRSIYMLAPESRGRLNGLFIACAFLGGSTGSGLAPAMYTFYGWGTLANIGVLFVLAALVLYLSEFPYRGRRAP
jgi:predicted MFS family arabinose efflux permease